MDITEISYKWLKCPQIPNFNILNGNNFSSKYLLLYILDASGCNRNRSRRRKIWSLVLPLQFKQVS